MPPEGGREETEESTSRRCSSEVENLFKCAKEHCLVIRLLKISAWFMS